MKSPRIQMCCYVPILVALMFSALRAQDVPETGSLDFYVSLLQGEDIQLSEDFVARLDGEKLRVSLVRSGEVMESEAQEFLVTLIQPGKESIELQPNQQGIVEFDGVQEGLAAVVIAMESMLDSTQSAFYAALPIFAASAATVPVSTTSIPLADVNKEQFLRDFESSSEIPTSIEEILDFDPQSVAKYSRYRVRRRADGSITGRVVVLQRGYDAVPGVTRLAFFKNGNFLASTFSSPEGEFVAENMPVGICSVVATGPAGHAAYAFEIVENAAIEAVQPALKLFQQQTRFVSTQNQDPVEIENNPEIVADNLIVILIPPSLMPEVRRVVGDRFLIAPEVPADAGLAGAGAAPMTFPPMAPGMAGMGMGGGFGGAGGGFGGGGIGGALGLAGLAIGIAALENNNDGFNNNIATPVAPN
ncbi:MAG: carboxypeptidase regulatory-like domain-containing protein [Planctomycetales bacterium]|nr:carboxypeptidase regulatory-like domain-containing protein [Planctomycetales bacterium]